MWTPFQFCRQQWFSFTDARKVLKLGWGLAVLLKVITILEFQKDEKKEFTNVQIKRIEIYQVLTKLSFMYWIPYEGTLEFFLLYYIVSVEDNGRSWHSVGNCQKPIANWRRKLVFLKVRQCQNVSFKPTILPKK